MVLAEIGGLMQSGELSFESELACSDPWARETEAGFLAQLYQLETVRDDAVAEPWHNVPWKIAISGFGVEIPQHRTDDQRWMGSYTWTPPIESPEGLERLAPRQGSVDRQATLANLERAQEAFGDLLPARIRYGAYFWWTTGMTWTAIDLIGMETLMYWMIDEPDAVHRLMRFLCDDMKGLLLWAEQEGLLTANNENDYVGSGTMGYTSELPRGKGSVRLSDIWLLSESQETVGVGPDMFEEFIFPYQAEIAQLAGLTYYGCCEPIHNRFHVVRRFPHLRKVSVSPWCDREFMAREATDFVQCIKPNPTMVSGDGFDEAAIRKDLDHAVRTAEGCAYELVMKDVHTLRGDLPRLAKWVELARQATGTPHPELPRED